MKDSKKYSRMVTFYHNIRENASLNFIDELICIEKKYGIHATYNIAGKLFERQPELINKISEAGHEVSFYLNNHVPILNPKIFFNELKAGIGISEVPVGYHSPKSEWNNGFLEAFWQNGYLWNADVDEQIEPYFIYKGLVRLPIAYDDSVVEKGKVNLEKWVQKFSFFLESRKYFGYGLNDYVFNLQKYLETYESVIKLALKHNVFVATFSQAADLFRRSNLVHYYSLTGNGWNKRTRVLYRTTRFQELIRNEVVKLKAPIIVDLGSGGGVLSTFLKDIAAKIYCIDNAPGMINDIQTDLIVQSILGEVTATSLPDNSADFIICARIIEYMYYPELTANEIKRIGKLGAKFFVTFPAYKNDGPSNKGEVVPDKIRKHHTREEVLAWANQIGPGKLIGIQYDEAEPQNINDEKRYREIEQEQPSTQNPTNWVFIGTVENKKLRHTNFDSIPLNKFSFNGQE